jgi:hypothetical protein
MSNPGYGVCNLINEASRPQCSHLDMPKNANSERIDRQYKSIKHKHYNAGTPFAVM